MHSMVEYALPPSEATSAPQNLQQFQTHHRKLDKLKYLSMPDDPPNLASNKCVSAKAWDIAEKPINIKQVQSTWWPPVYWLLVEGENQLVR